MTPVNCSKNDYRECMGLRVLSKKQGCMTMILILFYCYRYVNLIQRIGSHFLPSKLSVLNFTCNAQDNQGYTATHHAAIG